MEDPILKEIFEKTLESESNDCILSCSYIDLPELITDIKQEIIGEHQSAELNKDVKVKEEPLLLCEEQPYSNSLLVLNHVKTEPIESKETMNCYNFSGEQFNIEHGEISETANIEENEEGTYFTSSLETANIDMTKNQEGGSGVASVANREAKGRKKGQRGLTHKCTECPFVALRKDHLKNHMIVHVDLNNDPKFACDQCEYKSCHRGNFTRHVQRCKQSKVNIERGDKVMLLKCTDCEYQTVDYRNLSRHILRHKSDSEVEIHKCNQCGYQTKYKSNMNLHIRRHVRREQLEVLKCPECEYQTFDKNNLDQHIFRHSAENGKTHQCEVCGYITLKKSHLKIHVLRHKDSTEVKMFQCPLCSYRAIRNSDLNRHIYRHKTGKDKKYPNSSIGVIKRLTTLQ